MDGAAMPAELVAEAAAAAGAYLRLSEADAVMTRAAASACALAEAFCGTRLIAAGGGWGDLPAPVAQGIVLLAVHLFEHREGGREPPAAVAALWRPYRRVRLS